MTYKPQSKTKAFTEVYWTPESRAWQAVRNGLAIFRQGEYAVFGDALLYTMLRIQHGLL